MSDSPELIAKVAELDTLYPELHDATPEGNVPVEGEERTARLREMAIEQLRLAPVIERADRRHALRAQWEALPAWIRGPFQHLFTSANELLDLGRDEDAEAMISYADPPSGYSETQRATFATVRAQFAEAIRALSAPAIAVAIALLSGVGCASLLPVDPESRSEPVTEFRAGLSGPGLAIEWTPLPLFGYGLGVKLYLVTPGGGELPKMRTVFREVER